MSDVDNFLAHYGVKGMKWGVRKDRKSRLHPDAREAKAIRKKKLNQMSNAEIKKLTERMNLEKNYKSLTPGALKRGKAWVGGGIATAGMAITIYNMAHSPAGKAAINFGKKIVDTVMDLLVDNGPVNGGAYSTVKPILKELTS